jgi:hypothetical protein
VEPRRRSSRLISSVRIACKQTPCFLPLAGPGIPNYHRTFRKSGFESDSALFILTFVVRNYFHSSDIREECNGKKRKHLLCILITKIIIHLNNLDSSLEFPHSLATLLYLLTFSTPSIYLNLPWVGNNLVSKCHQPSWVGITKFRRFISLAWAGIISFDESSTFLGLASRSFDVSSAWLGLALYSFDDSSTSLGLALLYIYFVAFDVSSTLGLNPVLGTPSTH